MQTAYTSLAQLTTRLYPADAAGLLEAAPVAEIGRFFETLPTSGAVSVLKHMVPDVAARVVSELSAATTKEIVSTLDPHRAASLLSRLDEKQRDELLEQLEPGIADDLRGLLSYPRDTAGGMMDPRVTAFRAETPIRNVIKQLRGLRQRRIQDLFIIDSDGKLTGMVPLQDAVIAEPDRALGSVATATYPSVPVTAPREEVVSTLEKNRLGSLPVVDFDGRLLGVLRQRELLAVTEQKAHADLVSMVGASKEERALSSPWFSMRKRLPWLEVNLGTAFLAASVVGIFEATIAKVTALAVLLPVVAGQSGNTGAQALAVTMRGLALREIRVRHWLRVAGKEVAVGALNGVVVSVTTSVAVLLWSGSQGLAAVIGVSMIISMVAAALAGALIPMFLTAIRQDPAQSSSIILTTVTDVVGFFSFLGIATLLASHLPSS